MPDCLFVNPYSQRSGELARLMMWMGRLLVIHNIGEEGTYETNSHDRRQ